MPHRHHVGATHPSPDSAPPCPQRESVAGNRHGNECQIATPDGIERHHMPADSISPVKRSQGPAIQMDKADHAKTALRPFLRGAELSQ